MKNNFLSFYKLRDRWKEAFQEKYFLRKIFLCLFVLCIVVIYAPKFFYFIQTRKGFQLNDPILNYLPAIDFSQPIFLLIYIPIIIAIIILSYHPKNLLVGLQCYVTITVVRMILIFIFPLEIPRKFILLHDPFADRFIYGQEIITKDLFFSGHTATIVLMYFLMPYKPIKLLFLIASILLGTLILFQHVHYTIDVCFAPIITWIIFSFLSKINGVKKLPIQ